MAHTRGTAGEGFHDQISPADRQGAARADGQGYATPRLETAGPAPIQGYDAPSKRAEELAYERGQQDAIRRLTTPRMSGWRVICGICWACWTLLFGVGALVSLFQGSFGPFLIAGVLAGLAGWYDYRIWTLKARRLTLFIVF